MTARRGLLLSSIGALLALSGCGWEPLYADRETAPADAELRAIKMAPIAERIGQRLAWALRAALNPDGVPTPPRYLLRTTLTVARVDLGIQSLGLGTRGRLDVVAAYALYDLKTSVQLMAASDHVAQSFDILANMYSNLVAEEDARRRAVEELSRDMMLRLSLFLQHRAAPKAPPAKP